MVLSLRYVVEGDAHIARVVRLDGRHMLREHKKSADLHNLDEGNLQRILGLAGYVAA